MELHLRKLAGPVIMAAYTVMLALAVRHELLGPIDPDASVFLVIGRGILNGLTPYRDLFDFKPPGIFLLAAASLKLTGGVLGLLIAEAAVVVALPLLTAWLHRDRTWGFVFGSALALLVMQSAGNVSVESFGALFACAYVLVIVQPWKWRHILTSILVCAAVLMKEPFALSIAAASLLLFPGPQILLRRCAWSVAGAVTAWAAVILLLGYMKPYWQFYWPYTMAMRVTEQPWLRGLQVWELLGWTAQFSIMFGAVVVVLLVLKLRSTSWRDAMATLGASYIVSVATLLGAAGTAHFAISAPFMLALFVSQKTHIATKVLLAALPLSVSFSAFNVAPDALAADRQAAAVIDQLMDDCEVERYVYMGGIGSFVPAFMRHLPLGPAFFISDYTARVEDLARSYPRNVREADLILFEQKTRVLGSEKWIYDLTQNYVVEHFSATPWACVRQSPSVDGFTLLYRKREVGSGSLSAERTE